MKKTTEKQDRFLRFINNFFNENGYSPSVREIASGLGLASTSGVQSMIDRLHSKGLLSKSSGNARTLMLSGHFGHTQDMGIPILGRIKAGHPVSVDENIEGYINEDILNTTPGSFFLKVDGDSMKDLGIINGDYALIKPQKNISNGETGAFRINGEVTLKTFRKTSEGVFLIPANEEFSPISVNPEDEFEVIGKFSMLLRLVK